MRSLRQCSQQSLRRLPVKDEEETESVGRFFLYLIAAVIVLLVLTGCTTTGRTTVNEDSLICLGFCMETDFEPTRRS